MKCLVAGEMYRKSMPFVNSVPLGSRLTPRMFLNLACVALLLLVVVVRHASIAFALYEHLGATNTRRLLQDADPDIDAFDKHETDDFVIEGRKVVTLPDFPCVLLNCSGDEDFQHWYAEHMEALLEKERAQGLAKGLNRTGGRLDGSESPTTTFPGRPDTFDGNDFTPEVMFNRWFVEEVEASDQLLSPGTLKELDKYAATPGNANVPKPYGRGKGPSKKAFVRATCGADIIGASAFTAGIGLSTAAAVRDCNYSGIGRPAACSQDLFSVMRTTSTVVEYCSNAAAACGGVKNAACSQYIGGMMKRATTIAEAVSRMTLICGNQSDQLFQCGYQLERLAWQLGGFGGDLGGGVRICIKDAKAPVHDYGMCVGEVLSAATYVASASLEISAEHDKCDSDPATCAYLIASSLRALSLAANKASRAAQFCGGKQTKCGQDISLMASGLLVVAQDGAGIARFCDTSDKWGANKCAIFISSINKGLVVSTAEALDAASSCRGDNAANIGCGSALSKALASIGYMSEQISRATMECSTDFTQKTSTYQCSRDIERIGQAGEFLSKSIGASVVDCGLIGGPRLIPTIDLPRRFFTAD